MEVIKVPNYYINLTKEEITKLSPDHDHESDGLIKIDGYGDLYAHWSTDKGDRKANIPLRDEVLKLAKFCKSKGIPIQFLDGTQKNEITAEMLESL